MKKGSKLWAKSCITMKNGDIIYVENPIDYVEEQMNCIEEKIVLDVAFWLREKTIYLKKKDIKHYEKCS